MNDKEMVFNLRKRIFEEWRWKRLTWQEVKEKYGFSKKWFYKWLGRFLKYGEGGLRDRVQKRPPHPYCLGWDEEAKILGYIYENPTHGPGRIAREIGFRISGKTIWKLLKAKDLNTRRRRKLWAYNQGKPVLTKKEIRLLQAKYNHVESYQPGELLSMDTFWCNVKSLGKIFMYTACDTYSSYGWAKVYKDRIAPNSIDFLGNHILKKVPEGKIKRVLTDQGTEFYSARNKDRLHSFTGFAIRQGVIHSLTKVAHPWTNGYVERLNQTIWQEFYLCRLNRPYDSIDELNENLQKFMTHYNWKRMHSGYKLREWGYNYPGHAFFDLSERYTIVGIKELKY